MKITRVHHIAIIASDYEKSKKFYTEILGLKVRNETNRKERKSWKLDLELPGGGEIELFSFPDPPKRVSNPEATGLRHLAFGVADLDEAIEYLKKHEVVIEEPRDDPTTGNRTTFFRDPDDLPLELYKIKDEMSS
jgi:glyoxylase I family protein